MRVELRLDLSVDDFLVGRKELYVLEWREGEVEKGVEEGRYPSLKTQDSL
jgi:hypothetical protein